MADYAKVIKTGRNKLFDFCRQLKLTPETSTIPYQQFIDRGYWEVTEVKKGDRLFAVARITGKGQVYVTHKLKTAGHIK